MNLQLSYQAPRSEVWLGDVEFVLNVVNVFDRNPPYVDGRKVASAVKALASSMPVILLTGWGQQLVSDRRRHSASR